jgi:hypothetical protein
MKRSNHDASFVIVYVVTDQAMTAQVPGDMKACDSCSRASRGPIDTSTLTVLKEHKMGLLLQDGHGRTESAPF